MKKVLSFCVFCALLALFCVGVKAQAPSGLQMTPANLPSPIVLEQYDTVYLSPTGCFSSLGLLPTDSISIEWAVLRNGDTIPEGELSRYFNEFKFQTRYPVGGNVTWYGDSYVSEYCYDGNGFGSYPGAYSPTANLGAGQACERDGHFNPIINRADRMNSTNHQVGFEFDWFYVRFFTDPASGLRLVYNFKEDGDYQFVFQIWKRCNGSKWDLVTMNNDQRYCVGGHQSVRCQLMSSDTLHSTDTIDLPDQYICIGDTLWMGIPPVAYFATGDYTAIYHGASSCSDVLDSVINFHLNVENPIAPILDTLNSNLIFCDSGVVTVTAVPQLADNCIWYNAVGDSVYTGTAYTFNTDVNTTVYAVSYNTLSGCVSPDSLEVKIEVYPTPTPVVSVDTNAQCEGGAFNFELTTAPFSYFVWNHNGTVVDTITTYTFTAPAITANAGEYFATVADTFHHTLYNVEIGCAANSDTVSIVVYDLPTIALTDFDGAAYAAGNTFCPNDGTHTATYTVSNGAAPYTLTWVNTSATHTMVDDVTFTSTINAPDICGATYSDAVTAVVDAHTCAWNGNIDFAFAINDTIAPEFVLNGLVIDAAPAYNSAEPCAYILPDVLSLIDTVTDNCDTILKTSVIQHPAAGTFITDSTVVMLSVFDHCGNVTDTTVMVAVTYVPVNYLADVTAEVKCAGECNASITVTVNDGHAPYDVTLQQGATTYAQHGNGPFVFNGLCEGDWNINVVDSNFCTTTDTLVSVSSPVILSMDITDSTDLLCYHDATGSFKFEANGGRLPFNVVITKDGADFQTWISNTVIDTTMSGLAAGKYVVTVTDDSLCVVVDSVVLTEPDSLQTTSEIVLADVSCYGLSDGSATVTVIGGTLPYSFAWTNLSTNASAGTDSIAINLPAADYKVVVTDAHGCVDSAFVTIHQPDTLAVISVRGLATNSNCPRQTSYEFTSATNGGGTPNYHYTWTINGTDVRDVTGISDTTDAYSHVPSIISCDTTLNITFTVVDDHGCTATGDTTFRIFDTENPIIAGLVNDTILYGCDSAEVPAFLTDVAAIEATLGLQISDNCTADADLTVTYADVATGSCPTTVARTYTITDQCGLDASFTYTFTIKDTVKPTFTAPADIVIYKDSSCNYDATLTVTGNATNLNDNCSNLAELTARLQYVDAVAAGSCEGETVISRTWTLEDVCGNAAVPAVQVITIKDTIKPWFTTAPKNDTVYCYNDDVDLFLNDFLNYPVAVDNCVFDSIQKNFIDTVHGCNSASYTLNYEFKALDKCGNFTTANASFTVKDTLKPRFTNTAVDNVIVDADTICDFSHVLDSWQQSVTYEDYCVPTSEITLTIDTIWTPSCGHAGEYKITWTLDDGCNINKDSATFTIRDINGPRIYPAPLDTTVNCDGDGNVAAFHAWLSAPHATDGCVADPITVTYTYTFNGHDEYPFSESVMDADGIHYKGWQNDGSCSGYYDIIWHATDACGNESTTRERFRISDLQAPQFTNVPTADTIECDLYSDALRDAWAAGIEAYDSCPKSTLTLGAGITRTATFHEACSPATGRWDIVWTASDACSNSNTTQASYYVVDTHAPVLVNIYGTDTIVNDTIYFKRDCSVNLPTSFYKTLAEVQANHYGGIASFTDCSILPTSRVRRTIGSLISDGDCQDVYDVVYEISDLCHNTASFHGKIVVLDTLAPTYANNIDTTINMTSTCTYPDVPVFTTISEMNATNSNPQITDCNLYDAGVAMVPATPADTTDLACGKQVIRTYVLTDLCGNDTTITQTIVIRDVEAPVISTSVKDTVYSLATCGVNTADTTAIYAQFANVASILAAYPALSITDCSDMTVARGASTTVEGRCPEKTITTTFTVTDACGNASDLTHTLIILDTVSPALPAAPIKNDTIYLGNPDACAYVVNPAVMFTTYADVQAWDPTFVVTDCHVDGNSAVNLISADTTAFSCNFQIHYVYEVLDSCDNASAPFTMTTVVLDTTKPAVTGTLADTTIYLSAAPSCTTPAVAPYTKASELVAAGLTVKDCNIVLTDDNVTLAKVDTLPSAAMACERTVVRCYIVSDLCGNKSDTIKHNIILLDTTGPAVAGAFNVKVIDLDETDCTSPAVDTFHRVADVDAYLALMGGDFTYADCNIDENCVVTLVSVDSSAARCPRVVTRTYVMYDKCGNVSPLTFNQIINIRDITAPVVTGALNDSTIFMADWNTCTYPAVAPYTTVSSLPATIHVTDCNLNSEVDLLSSDTAFTSANRPNVITITRHYQVTDSCGHNTAFNHIIYVQDTFAPIVNTDYTDAATGNAMVKDTVVYQKSDCSVPDVDFITWANHTSFAGMNSINDCQLIEAISHDSTSGPHSPIACNDTIVRFYSVMDSTHNVTVFEQRIIVLDTLAPIVTGTLADLDVYKDSTCSAAASLAADAPAYTKTELAALVTVTDCHEWSITSVSEVETRDDQNCGGTYNYYIRTYTLADECGNDTTISQHINILDTIKPWLSAAIPNQPANSVGGCVFQIPDLSVLVGDAFVDNCSDTLKTYTQTPAAGTVITDTTVVRFTFTDSCDLATMDSILVTVPAPLVLDTVYADSVICHYEANGAIHMEVSGGTAPYTYFVGTDPISGPDTLGVAAGVYTVKAVDADGCFVTDNIEVFEPDTLAITLTLDNYAICQKDTLTISTTIAPATAGTPRYNYEWSFLSLTDTTSINTVSNTDATNTMFKRCADTAGTFQYVVEVTDARGCVATDTVTSVVNPVYEFTEYGRVCQDSDFVWTDHRTIYATEMPVTDSTYTFYDSLLTVNGCDSVYILLLRNENVPYLTVRRIGEPESALTEEDLNDIFYTGVVAGNKGYEIFVKRNCTACSENVHVSLEYSLYRYDEDAADYVLMTNHVNDYFTPTYRTYMDMYALNPVNIQSGTVSIPNDYPNISLGGFAGDHYDYFNLCWLSPVYDCSFGTPGVSSGTYYNYGRANTIAFTQFTQPGKYKIVAHLQDRSSAVTAFHSVGYCTGNGEVGGHASQILAGDTVYSEVAMFFEVRPGAGPVSPSIDPMDGVVVATEATMAVPTATVYPNPARDVIQVAVNGFEGETSVSMTNASGTVLTNEIINIPDTYSTPIIRIKTAEFAQGIYMVTVRSKDAIVTKRVVIIK